MDYTSIPIAWWQLKNDLLPLTQYTQNDIIFSIGNPDLFFDLKNEVSYSDSLYFKYLFPVNQEVLDKGDCGEFINRNNIKYLYLKKGVDLPTKVTVDTCFISEKINGSFYIFKPSILQANLNRLGGKIGYSLMDFWKMFEIDEPDDLKMCSTLMKEFLI